MRDVNCIFLFAITNEKIAFAKRHNKFLHTGLVYGSADAGKALYYFEPFCQSSQGLCPDSHVDTGIEFVDALQVDETDRRKDKAAFFSHPDSTCR